jgi:integrase
VIRRAHDGEDGMDLSDFLEQQFFLLRSKTQDAKTYQHYRRAVRWLGEMLGRPALLEDLTDDHVAAAMKHLMTTRGQSAVTANGTHKCLCCLWRFARDKGLLSTGPTVSPLPTPRRTPRAWRREELARLVEAARNSTGAICGLPAGIWWSAVLAISWDTGVRAGELLSLRWDWLDFETGWLHVPAEARKGKHHDEVYGLAEDTLSLLKRMPRTTPLIFGWTTMHRSRYWQLWKELLKRAGLPATRYTATQCLRRTFATWLEVGGGSATDALGHSSRDITRRAYIDPTLTRARSAERIPFRLLDLTPAEQGGGPALTVPFRAVD